MLMQFGSFKHIMSLFFNNNNFTSIVSTNFDSLDGFRVLVLEDNMTFNWNGPYDMLHVIYLI